jgi:hypothetical protein
MAGNTNFGRKQQTNFVTASGSLSNKRRVDLLPSAVNSPRTVGTRGPLGRGLAGRTLNHRLHPERLFHGAVKVLQRRLIAAEVDRLLRR